MGRVSPRNKNRRVRRVEGRANQYLSHAWIGASSNFEGTRQRARAKKRKGEEG
jgi:hypothetical protein